MQYRLIGSILLVICAAAVRHLSHLPHSPSDQAMLERLPLAFVVVASGFSGLPLLMVGPELFSPIETPRRTLNLRDQYLLISPYCDLHAHAEVFAIQQLFPATRGGAEMR